MIKILIIIITLLISSCAKPKSQILGGILCECGRDNPSWRKGFCPECYNFSKEKVDTTQKDYIVNIITN